MGLLDLYDDSSKEKSQCPLQDAADGARAHTYKHISHFVKLLFYKHLSHTYVNNCVISDLSRTISAIHFYISDAGVKYERRKYFVLCVSAHEKVRPSVWCSYYNSLLNLWYNTLYFKEDSSCSTAVSSHTLWWHSSRLTQPCRGRSCCVDDQNLLLYRIPVSYNIIYLTA